MKRVLLEFLGKYKEEVDDAIAQELAIRLEEVTKISPHLVPILQAMRELSGAGKRLRAMLTILGYHIAAGSKVSNAVIRAAAVMELFHLGLLIQDDVMDRDEMRRGLKTIHHRYDDLHLGESVAICAGDLPFGWGMEIIAGLKLDPVRLNEAIKVWGKYFTRVGYGQILDVFGEQRGNTSDEEVLKVLMIKSGEYSCVLPLILGATLGGADEKLLNNLKSYAMELGWVFQLRDDWLAEFGDTSKTGKPVGNDSREGKRTFVTMYGREKAELAIAEHMDKARNLASGISSLSGDSRKVMLELVEWVGTREN